MDNGGDRRSDRGAWGVADKVGGGERYGLG